MASYPGLNGASRGEGEPLTRTSLPTVGRAIRRHGLHEGVEGDAELVPAPYPHGIRPGARLPQDLLEAMGAVGEGEKGEQDPEQEEVGLAALPLSPRLFLIAIGAGVRAVEAVLNAPGSTQGPPPPPPGAPLRLFWCSRGPGGQR